MVTRRCDSYRAFGQPAKGQRRARWRSIRLGATRTGMLMRRIVVGAAVGYGANRLMDVATSWFYEQQSDASKAREEEVFPGGAIIAGGRDIANMLGIEADDQKIEQLGMRAHRGIAMAYGAIGGLLVGFGMRPMRAGLLVGALAFVLVDEALNAVQLEPSPTDFPIEAHMRGVVGHATYGAVLGAGLTLARPLLRR
jgi:hypothetical protein